VRITLIAGISGAGSGMLASARRRGRSGATPASQLAGGVAACTGSGTGESFAMKYPATRRFSDTALSEAELEEAEDRSVSCDSDGAGAWEHDTGRGRGPRVLGSRRAAVRPASYAGGASSMPSIIVVVYRPVDGREEKSARLAIALRLSIRCFGVEFPVVGKARALCQVYDFDQTNVLHSMIAAASLKGTARNKAKQPGDCVRTEHNYVGL
jgi:hypothetical protein